MEGDLFRNVTSAFQVAILSLQAGHNMLKWHIFNILEIGDINECIRGNSKIRNKHLLEECSTYMHISTQRVI